jgi:tetratricopeptide (TPR) repeat protein
MAVGKRIMIVDADEQLDQKSLYILQDGFLNPKYDGIETIFIKLRNYYTLQTGEFAEVVQARIFRNTGEPIYSFAIHNKPRVDVPYLFLDTVIFNHYGYLFEKADLFLEKKERSLPMLQDELGKEPDSMHLLTHIIKTYYACNDHEHVVEHGKQWVALLRKVEFHEGWFAYLEVFSNILGSYVQLGDTRNAERILKEAEKYSMRLISLYLILGQYYLVKKRYERARELFEHAYLMAKQEGTAYELLCSTNTAVIMPEILNYLAIMCFNEGDYAKAGKYLNEGIRLNENRLPLRWDIWNESVCKHNIKGGQLRRKQR